MSVPTSDRDLFADEVLLDPYPVLAELREQGGVVHLPVNDVDINRAIARQYALEALPKPDEVVRIGTPWRPWATVACWYLWRSEDVKLPVGDEA